MAADGGYGAKIGFDPTAAASRTPGLHAGEDFPQLCETCLGLNPYVRMIKTAFGSKLCKVSSAPYQGFRWKAGPHGRFKETTICFDVARHKNICQSCLNDMQYGLPVGVRDSILVGSLSAVKPPDSAVGKAVFYSQQSRPGDGHAEGSSLFSNDIKNAAPSRQLDHFSNAMYAAQSNNREKTAFRNLPKLCSFWLNGTCSRVVRSVCPFRPCCGVYVFPELASTHRDLMDLLIDNLNKFGAVEVQKTLDPLLRSTFRDAMKGNRDESIRKRVNGEDDLTQKYLKKMRAGQLELSPPADASVTTLWVGNLTSDILADDIRSVFFPYGRIVNIHLVTASKCAFIEYSNRGEAENAAEQLFKMIVIKGQSLSLKWAKPRAQAVTEGSAVNPSSVLMSSSFSLPPPPGMKAAPSSAYAIPGMALPSIHEDLSTVHADPSAKKIRLSYDDETFQRDV